MTDEPGTATGGDEAADLAALVERVPAGWTVVTYANARWGLSRTDRAGGASTSLFAERFGGPGVISANVWRTRTGEVLRPCEMPAQDVLDFLRGWSPDGGSARSG